jgi:hypothetical protein
MLINLVLKKEYIMFDIIFMSYEEPNAEEHWEAVKQKYPWARRVHGVKGLVNAHVECAKLCRTDMYYHIEADNELTEEFDPSFKPSKYDRDTVHVWRAKNSVNDLVYGYSGIKLFPKKNVLALDPTKVVDFTTSVSDKFKAVQIVGSTVHYDTDPYNTWKASFRECAKLSARIIDRQKDAETDERLNTWCSVGKGAYGDYSIAGALDGTQYGKFANKDDMVKVNDWDWLKDRYEQATNR